MNVSDRDTWTCNSTANHRFLGLDPFSTDLLGNHAWYQANITPATKIRTNPYSRSRLPRDQRSTTECTEIHGKENPNQLPLSVSFPGATPARRVGSFGGYPFVMIFLAGVIARG